MDNGHHPLMADLFRTNTSRETQGESRRFLLRARIFPVAPLTTTHNASNQGDNLPQTQRSASSVFPELCPCPGLPVDIRLPLTGTTAAGTTSSTTLPFLPPWGKKHMQRLPQARAIFRIPCH